MQESKNLIIGLIVTLVLILAGVFVITRKNTSTMSVPENAIVTSGLINGEYLPANPSAKATLVEFGDYQCPACSVYNNFVKKILIEFPGKVNYVFRNYPLPQHQNAHISSKIVEAAFFQGKYWQMHDKLFETQSVWSNDSSAEKIIINYASQMGINTDILQKDINSQSVADKIKKDMEDGTKVKLGETPTFYLNGQKLKLTGDYTDLSKPISDVLNK